MGHALFATLQDITTRYQRMTGRPTLWLPGTDHAGLATQAKLETAMIEEGLDPYGKEFDSFSENYKKHLKSTITGQLRRCGASCDWDRETFTLDEGYSRAVTEAMRRCHDAGMLYWEDSQWWLDMRTLASRLLGHIDAGDIKIIPSGKEGTLRNFLNKIEPWCISRQIRWGHKLPIWKNGDDVIISDTCPQEGYNQEEGCLDTWFSSALWPFATLGWPNDTEDMRKFYPASMIETADDILFFWCARMMMMGLLLTDKLPFKSIFLHGLIRDENGVKMSKSEGNGIDPLDIIDQYGCDAMRISLAESATPGQDMRIWDEKFKAGKSVSTKLWNASKYTLSHWNKMGSPDITEARSTNNIDLEMINRTNKARNDITKELETLRYHEAAQRLRNFIFDDFCSWYIEQTKSRLYDERDMEALSTLMWSLDRMLRMAHPFMPFITERIRQAYSSIPLISDAW